MSRPHRIIRTSLIDWPDEKSWEDRNGSRRPKINDTISSCIQHKPETRREPRISGQPSIFDVPDELLIFLAETIPDVATLNAVAQAHSHLYIIFNKQLYDVESTGDDYKAIHWAVQEGQNEVLEWCLARRDCIDAWKYGTEPRDGIDMAAFDDRLTPLQRAIACRQENIACKLIKHGADLERVYPAPWPNVRPIHIACTGGLLEAVKLLWHDGAWISMDGVGQSPLHYTVAVVDGEPRTEDHVKILGFLLELGSDFHRPSLLSMTAEASIGEHFGMPKSSAYFAVAAQSIISFLRHMYWSNHGPIYKDRNIEKKFHKLFEARKVNDLLFNFSLSVQQRRQFESELQLSAPRTYYDYKAKMIARSAKKFPQRMLNSGFRT